MSLRPGDMHQMPDTVPDLPPDDLSLGMQSALLVVALIFAPLILAENRMDRAIGVVIGVAFAVIGGLALLGVWR